MLSIFSSKVLLTHFGNTFFGFCEALFDQQDFVFRLCAADKKYASLHEEHFGIFFIFFQMADREIQPSESTMVDAGTVEFANSTSTDGGGSLAHLL